jgi:hypothetical protein
VPTRSLGPMTTSNHIQDNNPTHDLTPDSALDTTTARVVFADPVAYLETLGVAATLVAAASFPAAA